MTSKHLRARIDELLDQEQWAGAHVLLGDLWRAEGKTAAAGYVLSRYERLRGNLPLVKCRISLLRSMTLEPLIPILHSAALVQGIDPSIQVGQFNAYAQEILDPDSSLYSFDPEIVILAIQTRDILPELWDEYTSLSREEVNAGIDRVRETFAAWIRTFRRRSSASLVVHLLEKPVLCLGILEGQRNDGQLAAMDRLNDELRGICSEHRGVYALDYDGLIARYGRMRWHDESKWLTMRMPFATDSLLPMVSEWLKFIHPLTGAISKVLVVDLDDTLWGGVLGEDTPKRLQIGPEYPGAFYRSLQRVILDLYHRGVLLAICSKNNHDEAMDALQNLPGMLLRPEHFAAIRINWQDKAKNLLEIAAELNVGSDAIAFLDDNPVEREFVRSEIPQIRVIGLPEHPQGFAAALRECPFFERLLLTAEDQQLTRLYHVQRQRADLASSVGSLEEFYKSLNQEITIASVTQETVARVAQLTQKTNQFNVTTRRYTEQTIMEMAARPGCSVYSVRVTDRFGDNGIVGVLITQMSGDICEIDTLLLSCRVIGRTIETAMLAFLVETSRAGGARFLQGQCVHTAKNAPVRGLYNAHQFEPIADQQDATCWRLSLTKAEIAQPQWIRLHVVTDSYTTEQARA